MERRIVEQANRARLHLSRHTLGDLRRGEVFPVQTITVPYSGKSLQHMEAAKQLIPEQLQAFFEGHFRLPLRK